VGWALLIVSLLTFVWDTVFLLGRAAWEHPGRAGSILAFVLLSLAAGLGFTIAWAVTLIVAAVALRWAHEPTWMRLVGRWWRPAWVRWWIYERRWPYAMKESWLSNVIENGLDVHPPIQKVRVGPFGHVVTVRMLLGQTLDQWESKVDELASAFGAQSCRAFPVWRAKPTVHFEGRRPVLGRGELRRVPGRVSLEFAMRDPLTSLVPSVPIPERVEDIDYAAVPVGLMENGEPWTLKVAGSHLLVAGITGAGKGSLIWSVIKGLAPAIREGIVELWADDPKGGMELYPGRPLYKRYSDGSAAEQAALIADAVTEIQERTQRLKGTTRTHVPSLEEPLIIVLVDELGSLLKPLSRSKEDRDVAAQAELSTTLVVNQGRAVGVHFMGLLQDGRKEVVNMRDEIPQRIAMRTGSADGGDMILGKGAAVAGYRPDEIPAWLPGCALAHIDGRGIVRVRAAYVDDREIHALALEYAPPGVLSDEEYAEWEQKTAHHALEPAS
jgi:S-DNA-T family DNA segregation ATPase FtsK/SpoIIIE